MRAPESLNDSTRYTVIPRTLVFLTRGEEVLLLRGAPDKRLWAGKYNGLGGHIEVGEEPRRAARREVQEEAGLDVAELSLRAVIQVTFPEPPGVMLFVFVGAAPLSEPCPSPEGTPVWVQRQDIAAYPLVEDLYELLPRVLAPGEIIFGEYFLSTDGTEYRFAD
ncbi:MAG: NUDIX domain-containing protein [Chloroflexota bacterium]|nr:NUDIX domain-containing protein [Chloroflexota bacterium]